MYTTFREVGTDEILGYATEELFNDCADSPLGVARGLLVPGLEQGGKPVYGRSASDEGIDGYCQKL